MMTYVMVEEILDFNMDVAQLTNDEKSNCGQFVYLAAVWDGEKWRGGGGKASQKEDLKKKKERKLLIR